MNKAEALEVLGLTGNPVKEEVKAAWRKASRTAHPDKGGSDDAMSKVNEARDTLDDIRSGKAGNSYQDMMRDWARQQNHERDQMMNRGEDLRSAIALTIFEVFSGCEKDINVAGSTVRVNIPPGLDDGMSIRVAGKGGAPRSEKYESGDLFLFISIKKHPLIKLMKDGTTFTELTLSISEAIYGVSKEVVCLEGTYDVKIPSGVQPGHKLRMPNKGMKGSDAFRRPYRSDHLVMCTVKIPTPEEFEKEYIIRSDDSHGGSLKNSEGKKLDK